jgi:methionyl-tRNA formyltransferase
LKVTLASSSEVSIPILNYLFRSSANELVSVITNPDKATGRGQGISANKVANWCEEFKVEVDKPGNNAELLQSLERRNPELLITVAYGHILKNEVLNKPKFGCINLHYSLLPAYRGAAPVQWAILNGDVITGVTVFKLDAGMDTGPIYTQKELAIAPTESTMELLSKLNLLGVEMIDETLEMIADSKLPIAQSNLGISQAPKFVKSDGKINWNTGSNVIYNQFRALAHNPGVFTLYKDQKLRINTMVATDSSPGPLSPGEFVVLKDELVVGTGDGYLRISSLTPEGRKVMNGKDFFNGLADKKVVHFG